MTETFTTERYQVSAWFRSLRDDIVAAFEALEDSHTTGPFSDMTAGRFDVTETKRASDDGSDAVCLSPKYILSRPVYDILLLVNDVSR